MTDDASLGAAGADAGGPLPAAPEVGGGATDAPEAPRSIFDLRSVAPLSPEEQVERAEAMERTLAFGAEPVRDDRGWALEVDFIEANGEAVAP
ncbi:hypothetical protein HBA54_16585 [Pelagibius litoralis]|uniref:Uncharacterized protein n=1 Tax=Pelagibius litoralis TaxID=374515 RepID=A0A967EZE3_9PROT|nr:hypothetical protein [Pelagibius litoralis]NIA70225.1 hypothetical protein [Pelagibius litoralis]